MNSSELIRAIAVKDVDIDPFVQLAICDESSRDEMVHQMVTNPNIMVYYHCFYAVAKASENRPDLFMPYWGTFAALLSHANSYHRDFALTILANLTQIAQESCFSEIFAAYFEHIHDPKFMTGRCCVQNSLKIMKHLPAMQDAILALLLDLDRESAYSEKQKALLKGDVLDMMDQVYEGTGDKTRLKAFILACAASASPTTRRKARDLKVRYGL